jgi:adenosylcobinamide kinase / adenosylcobinamide-phosphate guanylyltransferase
MDKRLIFVLGGARSGKSTYAETLAKSLAERVLFVATAEAYDDEMRERIGRHRAERPSTWTTLEAPRDTAQAISEAGSGHEVVLLDCLTLLAANILLMLPEDCSQEAANEALLSEVEGLLAVYAAGSASWIVVSNEVGMGVVPPTRLGRFYRDMLGRGNQRAAMVADEVLLMVAGLPWKLK